jgi:tRNA-(ms[2]io[6]A)-hydroxylase
VVSGAGAALRPVDDRPWLARALAQLDEVLVDHAHCEKKAASSAVSLLFKYADRAPLLAPLSRLAREELVHFEEVLALLDERGVRFRHQMPSPYAAGLLAAVRPREPERLLDTLLCHALIEARSAARLALLADALPEPALADFYRRLVGSEVRHQAAYVTLAERVASPTDVAARLAVLAAHEAAVLADVPAIARLHA